MAEPLKNSFGPDVAVRIADMIGGVFDGFDRDAFLRAALDGFEALELTPRARQISKALAASLPDDADRAIRILVDSLGPEIEDSDLTGMASFLYLPHVFFVAEHGLGCFETSMFAQYELTKRFTAEFSIRTYLEHHEARTLDRLHVWARDPDVHVRRLVSEGTRPRLPWAPRLRAFQKDPAPVLELLELLKDDAEEYVRRSVANNLNDIAKDHPEVVVEVCRRWWHDASSHRRLLVRHGLRTLIKAGHPGALAILGYTADSPIVLESISCEPEAVRIGEKVRLTVTLHNPSGDEAGALIDLRVHFVKADGSTSPKVFKGTEVQLAPGEDSVIGKTISVAQHTTRKHYPGTHRVEVMINGVTLPGCTFDIA